MLYYYDTPIKEGVKRRQIKNIERRHSKRLQKKENKNLLLGIIYNFGFITLILYMMVTCCNI